MTARLLALSLVLLASRGFADAPHVAPTERLSPQAQAAGFSLPPGFAAGLVASEPAIQKPMNLAFDTRGRLWLTCSVEYPWPAGEGKGRDKVVVLSDFGPDGAARKVAEFATGLNIPIGLLPLPGGDSAIVHSIPNVYLLRDTNGDGKADERTILIANVGTRDTHGMVNSFRLGADGWVYACHGFANDSHLVGRDGTKLRLQSGNTFRFRPDGTRLEQVTWGQVNPFGQAIDDFGHVYSADCHSRPITQLIPGAVYQSFGKPHDGLGYGPDMIGHDHASTGLCGLSILSADTFPKEYRGTMLLGNVVTSRVNRDRLDFAGTSPRAVERPDFFTSKDLWFRPVDVLQGPDGAIYVADFYNRIIGHYEVPLTHPGRDRDAGRVWRVAYTGKDVSPTPVASKGHDFTKAPLSDLLTDMGHPNHAVRTLALHAAVARGADVAPELVAEWKRTQSPERAVQLLWALERLDRLTDDVLDVALGSGAALVKAHALRVLAGRDAVSPVRVARAVEALRDPEGNVVRLAGRVIARHGTWEAWEALARAADATPNGDDHRAHDLKVSLRNLAARFPAGLAGAARNGRLAEAALGVPRMESASYLSKDFADDRAFQHVARFGDAEALARLADAVSRTDDAGRLIARVQAAQRGSAEAGRPLPSTVTLAAERVGRAALASPDAGRVQAGLELASALRLGGLLDAVAPAALDRARPEGLRANAAAALGVVGGRNAVDALARLAGDAGEPVAVRESAARALGGLNAPEPRAALVATLATAPARLASAVALALADSPAGGEALLAAVHAGKASARLLQERPVALKLRERKIPNVDQRLAELTRGLPSADERVAALLANRRDAFRVGTRDLAAGQRVFAKNCANCHQVAGTGARVGPQLDGVGGRGLDRLLEDTLDPSRNVDQALRTTTVELEDGRVLTGLALREVGATLTLADAQGKEVAVPIAQIASRTQSLLSPMPANLAEQLPAGEFADLMAYLLSLRPRDAVPTP